MPWIITLLSVRRNHRSLSSPVQLDDVENQFWGFLEVVHRDNAAAAMRGSCKIVIEAWIYRLREATSFQINGTGKSDVQILEVTVFCFLWVSNDELVLLRVFEPLIKNHARRRTEVTHF